MTHDFKFSMFLHSESLALCVCVCTHMYIWVHAYIGGRGLRSMSSVFLYCFLRQDVAVNLEVASCLHFPSPRNTTHAPPTFYLESKLSTSCLHSIHLEPSFPNSSNCLLQNVAALYSSLGFKVSQVTDLVYIMYCCHILWSSATISPILCFYKLHWTNWLRTQIWPSICFLWIKFY